MQVNANPYAFRFPAKDQDQKPMQQTDFLSKFQKVFSAVKHRLTQLRGFLDKTERLSKQDPRLVVAQFKDLQKRTVNEVVRKEVVKPAVETNFSIPIQRLVMSDVKPESFRPEASQPRDVSLSYTPLLSDSVLVWEPNVIIDYRRSIKETSLPAPIKVSPKIEVPFRSIASKPPADTPVIELEPLHFSPRVEFNDLDCVCINLVQNLQLYQGTLKALLPTDYQTFDELKVTMQSLLVQSGMHASEGDGAISKKAGVAFSNTSDVFKHLVLAAVLKSTTIQDLAQFLTNLPVHPYKKEYLNDVFLMDCRLAAECCKQIRENPFCEDAYSIYDRQAIIKAVFSHYTDLDLKRMMGNFTSLKGRVDPDIQELLVNHIIERPLPMNPMREGRVFELKLPIVELQVLKRD